MSKQSRRKAKNKKGKKSRPSRHEPIPPFASWSAPPRADKPQLAKLSEPALLLQMLTVRLDLSTLGLEARELPDGSAFGLYLGDRRVGEVAEKYASVGRHRPLGDFLTADAPWGRVQDNLKEALELAQSRAVRAPSTAARADLLARAFRPGAGDPALAHAVEATQRIRTERSREYPFTATLEALGGRLVLDPVQPLGGGRVPFAFRLAAATEVRGVLQLSALGDVLPITLATRVSDATLRVAWVAVLSGFADLTCPAATSANDEPMWTAKALVATEATSRIISSTVAGHKRRLGQQRHGEGALERAAAIGIELREHETWVRSHTRGIPEGSVLEFDWTVGAELRDLLLRHDARRDAA